jgi:hypothetical protein
LSAVTFEDLSCPALHRVEETEPLLAGCRLTGTSLVLAQVPAQLNKIQASKREANLNILKGCLD